MTTDIASRTLADLKTELGKLTSYTTELGEVRESALASQHAAAEVLSLVGRLGDLQGSQIAELKFNTDSTLETHRQALKDLTDSWGQQWQKDAAQSLAVLDAIVGRQHLLATELNDFQAALQKASALSGELESLKTQTAAISKMVEQGASATKASLDNLDLAMLKQQQETQAALSQLAAKSSDLEASIKDHGHQLARHVEAQSAAHGEIQRWMQDSRESAKRWNTLTLVAVVVCLAASQLLR